VPVRGGMGKAFSCAWRKILCGWQGDG